MENRLLIENQKKRKMIGLTKPSSGMALVQGLDIRTDADKIYTSMGVCTQHDLLWETLTGREHLLFYGRLNLKGAALTQAVEESLKSVNLFYGGVGDIKQDESQNHQVPIMILCCCTNVKMRT